VYQNVNHSLGFSQERLLESKCGTLPYVAPEVLEMKYLAEPADIWSCGIILVALLAGGTRIFTFILSH
jgi:serine/threonine protein kinase